MGTADEEGVGNGIPRITAEGQISRQEGRHGLFCAILAGNAFST